MAEDAPHTAATTQAPHEGGFPPFDTTTFPSQLFWLAITFALLFAILWKAAGPRINGVITLRRNTINEAITAANKARGDADAASSAYEVALAGARARAQKLAEETRQAMNAEFAKAKAEADAAAAAAMQEADRRIAAMRVEANAHVTGAAREAAIAIVARLTGESVPPEQAAEALEA
jgi:F-type H+-transporting ATPase subunit b